eukprot:36160-Eustigmatos_ZCMA.PRE.1
MAVCRPSALRSTSLLSCFPRCNQSQQQMGSIQEGTPAVLRAIASTHATWLLDTRNSVKLHRDICAFRVTCETRHVERTYPLALALPAPLVTMRPSAALL